MNIKYFQPEGNMKIAFKNKEMGSCMPGWNLSQGQYIRENISEDEIWAILNHVFSTKCSKTTTYKYCFLKCLLDNIFNVDEYLVLDFGKIFARFTEVYWNLVAKHKLCQVQSNSQWQKSSVEIIIERFLTQYQFNESFTFESLRSDLQMELITKIGQECSKYVIGAFFSDSKGLFYSFSKKEKQLCFNPNVYAMFIKYKHIIEKLNYFEWIKFLEKVNPDNVAFAIAEKLDYSSKRNNLSNYRDFLFERNNQHNCFYCMCKIAKPSVEVDHFIPWSFVKDDKLWNLVLSCKNCNSKKSDKIPYDSFEIKIINRNIEIMHTSSDHLVEFDFKGYKSDKIQSMYKSAIFNGFDYGWQPRGQVM